VLQLNQKLHRLDEQLKEIVCIKKGQKIGKCLNIQQRQQLLIGEEIHLQTKPLKNRDKNNF